MTLNRISKVENDKTFTGYDYTYDGAYPPRVKGKDKKQRQKQRRRIIKNLTDKEIRQEVGVS